MTTRTLPAFVLLCIALFIACSGAGAAEGPIEPIKLTLPQAMQAVTKSDAPPQHISGGWGYTREDAMVLTTPKGYGKGYYNMVPLEYTLVDFRNDTEFGFNLPEEKRFRVVHYLRVKQSLVTHENKTYDLLEGEVYVIAEKDLAELQDVIQKTPKDALLPAEVMSKVTIHPRKYWFDITEPHAHNGDSLGDLFKANEPSSDKAKNNGNTQ